MDNPETNEWTIQRQTRMDNPETNKNGQSRDKQERTIQRQTRMDNPETSGSRHRTKTNKAKRTTQKIKKI